MLRLIGIITIIFLIYRWVVRPLLVIPQNQRRPQNMNAAEWLQEQLREFQERQQKSPNQPSARGKQRRQEEEYTDYEEVD